MDLLLEEPEILPSISCIYKGLCELVEVASIVARWMLSESGVWGFRVRILFEIPGASWVVRPLDLRPLGQ